MENKQKKNRKLQGVVVSDKMSKTRVVAVTITTKQHPKYLKLYRVTRKFKAHDEENTYKVGDKVVISETRPISKDKRWIVTGKI